VPGDNARILELRRRVQADPASIAFAQLAEECRRSGDNGEAVAICRAGLAHHPDYLSARVTLGRALVELGRLGEAQAELLLVLKLAPDNLPANRAIAELYQTLGQMPEALAHYKRALELAKYDPDLEHQVARIENIVSPPRTSPSVQTASSVIEDLFDFDTLLEQLGGRTQPIAESTSSEKAGAAPPVVVPSAVDSVDLREDPVDPFSLLERRLRESDERLYKSTEARADDEREREQRQIAELEDWLYAVLADREHRPSA